MKHWLFTRMAAAGPSAALIDAQGGASTYAALLERAHGWAAEIAAAPPGAVAIDLEGAEAVAAILGAILADRVALSLATWPAAERAALAQRAGARCLFTAYGPVALAADVPPTLAEARGGVVLFSSGTSGRPKPVLYPFAALVDRYERVRAPRRRSTVFPLDHVGGLSLLFHSLASGGALALVDHPARPHAVADAVARHAVEVLVASPTFLRMALLSGVDLGSLEQIVWSSEPLPAPIAAAAAARWPGARLVPSYGSTELGVLPTEPRPDHPGWFRIGVEHRIVDGRLWLRADAPMAGYLDGAPGIHAGGWYDTGDRVETEGPFLRVLGRETDVVNVGGVKVVPLIVEEALLSQPNITGARVEGRANAITGQVVVATVTLAAPEPQDALRDRLLAALRARLPAAAVPAWISVAAALDHTARLKLARSPR